ncbi:MAG: phage terminase large subunit family protein [Pirellulales bacterium]
MSPVQRLILAIVPAPWARAMRAESEQWRLRCLTCGNSRSVWEAGGIRWKAKSTSKRVMVRCPHCGCPRQAAIER